MHVGMNRARCGKSVPRKRVPHARGDEPAGPEGALASGASSPCTWG